MSMLGVAWAADAVDKIVTERTGRNLNEREREIAVAILTVVACAAIRPPNVPDVDLGTDGR